MKTEEPFHETDVEVEIIRRGVTQLHSIGQTFENWLDIGRALDVGRQISMRAAYVNQPKGRGYTIAYSQWLGMHPGLERIKSATRTALFNCLEHEPEILAWRLSRGDEERLHYNYPGTVFQRWQNRSREQGGTSPRPNRVRAEVERLKEENTRLKRQLEQHQRAADGAPLITRNATPDEMVRVLFDWLPAAKRGAVAAKLMQELQARRPGHG